MSKLCDLCEKEVTEENSVPITDFTNWGSDDEPSEPVNYVMCKPCYEKSDGDVRGLLEPINE